MRAIRELTARGGRPPGVAVGIGDDCAVVEPRAGASLLVTTDLLLEDVHFRRRWAEPADIGWKAMAVNLSDIASMGGRPRWAVVALACPEETTADEIAAFYEGALALARRHDVAVVGGDTSASPAGWLVNVTLLGEAVTAPRLRSAARPGDVIAVTGALGRSAAGLALLERGASPGGITAEAADLRAAHLRPEPRVAEGAWLGAAAGVRAMMDVSDGIGLDLPRLVAASDVGARVDVGRLPIDAATRAVATGLGVDPLAWATGGGEDYELLLTCEAAAFAAVERGLAAGLGTRLTAIGEVTAGAPAVRWVAGGRDVAVARGFEHFAARPAVSGTGS